MVWPVIYEASSEARNATNLDISSPLPKRPRGIDFFICFLESSSKKDEIINTIPLGRFGNADDVSELVYFLSSNEAAYITGQTISVDGGLLMN